MFPIFPNGLLEEILKLTASNTTPGGNNWPADWIPYGEWLQKNPDREVIIQRLRALGLPIPH